MPLEIDERRLGSGIARIRLEYALIPRQSFIDLSLADGDGGQPQQRIDVVAVATQGTRVLGLRFVEAICLQSLIGAFERRGTAGLAELQAGILGGRGWPGSGFRCAVLRRGG